MSKLNVSPELTAAGLTKLKLAYKNMIARCTSDHPHYAKWRNKGIKVCDEWLNSRDSFISWAVLNGHQMHLSLDRIDNGGNYEPSNCRWATITQQLTNQDRCHVIEFNGKKQTLSQWATELNIGQSTLWRRLMQYKVPLAEALVPGKLHNWRHGTRAGYEYNNCRCELCTANNTLRHQLRRAKLRAKNEQLGK